MRHLFYNILFVCCAIAFFACEADKEGMSGVGYLRLSFKSEGVENIKDFNPSTMIKEPKLVFKPDEALRTSILQNLAYEDGGVLADGVTYASRPAYLKAVGEGGTEEGSGEEEERPGGL